MINCTLFIFTLKQKAEFEINSELILFSLLRWSIFEFHNHSYELSIEYEHEIFRIVVVVRPYLANMLHILSKWKT